MFWAGISSNLYCIALVKQTQSFWVKEIQFFYEKHTLSSLGMGICSYSFFSEIGYEESLWKVYFVALLLNFSKLEFLWGKTRPKHLRLQ
mmetsp:Transcript_29791/g.38317  ORF Transcript_29791/g.38317 Transcript_29791/m.38317 type:complete len:89 (-) Transcript_29791:272-538(-)